MLRLVKGMVQGFLVELLGTDHAPGVLIKIRLYHSGFGVLRHKIPLVFFEIPLHGGAESQLEPAASVNLHRFRPHLLDIGSGSSFVLQNVNLGLLRVHHDGDKAAVAGTVKGQEVKSIEEIKSFLSRQKEVYKIPYETHPADRPRQCVFGGTSNALDFLPLDRSGNRRFIPVMVYPEQAEVHILEDEAASKAYIEQMWAEAMEIYRNGRFKLAFSPTMQRYLKEHQRDFMPEDTKAGMIQAYLDRYTGSMVCSKQLYKEALNHAFDEPKQWEIREINEIMNQCIDRWRYFPNPRMFSEYGRQKGWERENPATDSGNPSEKTMDGFVEVTEQMELPF